ncbi:MAG: hypothetical protein QM503_10985 [Bacteroidota bacterium]
MAYIRCSAANFTEVNGRPVCAVSWSVFTNADMNALIDSRLDLTIKNTQLTYQDFTLLGGGILSMFLVAYFLKQIRLIINR